MTASGHSDDERAEDEAAAWLLALSEEPDDDALRRRFEAWRTADARHAEIWSRTQRAYSLLGEAPPRHRAEWQAFAAAGQPHRLAITDSTDSDTRPAAAERPSPVRAMPRRRIPPRRLALGAMAAALAACLAWVLAPGLLLRLEASILTDSGELRRTVLADGTEVSLAPESAIGVSYTDEMRRIELLRGRVFLRVSPNVARPFRVAMGATTATVVGTAFEAVLAGDGATVAVREGQVRVSDSGTVPATQADLLAGDWLRIGRTGHVTRGHVPHREIAVWRNGELVLRDRSAADVVAALRPYYGGAIVVQSGSFAKRRVTGIYSLRDPEATLRELAASYGAVVRRITPWLLVVSDW